MNSCEVNPISAHYGLLQPCGSTVSGSVCGPKRQTHNAFHGTAVPCKDAYIILHIWC